LVHHWCTNLTARAGDAQVPATAAIRLWHASCRAATARRVEKMGRLVSLCAGLILVLALPSSGEAGGPRTPITAQQAAAAGPGHPWQAVLPGVNGFDLHKHTRIPLFAWRTQGGKTESFSLFHNSTALATNKALASQWTHSGDILVVTWREKRIHHAAVHWGSGRIQRFAREGDGYVSLDGYRDRLFQDQGEFILELKDGTVLAFRRISPRKSVVTSISDPNGNPTTYHYDRRKRLERIVDPVGRELLLTYSARARHPDEDDEDDDARRPRGRRLTQVTLRFAGASRVVDLSYDAAGLRTVQLPVFTTPSDPTPRRTTFGFEYDEQDNIVGAADSLDNLTAFRYDPSGRLTEATTPLGNTIQYALTGDLRTVTDAAGVTTTFEYDTLGRLARTQNANGAAWLRRYTDPQYGFAPSEVEAPLGIVERFSYDANGNVTSFTDSRGNTWNYTYDGAGSLLTRAEAPLVTGNTERGRTDFEYDARRNLVARARYLGGGTSLRESFAYDPFGNVVSRTNPGGQRWSYEYDPLGNLVQSSDPVGRTFRYAYTSAEGAVLFTRPDQVITGKGDLIQVDYDQQGRVRGKSFPDGTSVAYRYDAMGRLAAMTDPTGLTTWSFDADGRLSGEAKDSTPPLVDHALRFDYTPNNLLASIEIVGTTRKIRYTYDSVNRLAAIADNPFMSLVRDFANRLVALTRSNNVNTSYGYHPGSHVVNRITHVREGPPNLLSFNLNHAQDGTLREVAGQDGFATMLTRYRRDLAGRLDFEQGFGSNTSYTLNWTFDPSGNRIRQLSNGVARNFVFDLSGGTTSVTSPGETMSLVRDANDNLAARTLASPGGSFTVAYHYDYEGNATGFTSAGQEERRTLDGLQRTIRVSFRRGTQTGQSQFLLVGPAAIQEIRNEPGIFDTINTTIDLSGWAHFSWSANSGALSSGLENSLGYYQAAAGPSGAFFPQRFAPDGYGNPVSPSFENAVMDRYVNGYVVLGRDGQYVNLDGQSYDPTIAEITSQNGSFGRALGATTALGQPSPLARRLASTNEFTGQNLRGSQSLDLGGLGPRGLPPNATARAPGSGLVATTTESIPQNPDERHYLLDQIDRSEDASTNLLMSSIFTFPFLPLILNELADEGEGRAEIERSFR
jgi:YD repeat-containing protein